VNESSEDTLGARGRRHQKRRSPSEVETGTMHRKRTARAGAGGPIYCAQRGDPFVEDRRSRSEILTRGGDQRWPKPPTARAALRHFMSKMPPAGDPAGCRTRPRRGGILGIKCVVRAGKAGRVTGERDGKVLRRDSDDGRGHDAARGRGLRGASAFAVTEGNLIASSAGRRRARRRRRPRALGRAVALGCE